MHIATDPPTPRPRRAAAPRPFDTPISLRDHRTGRRVRLTVLPPGTALVPVLRPEPILGYSYLSGHLRVYVAGHMPAQMRTAAEDGTTATTEVLLVPALPAGIREIDLTDCRGEYDVLLPPTAKKAA